MKVKITLLNGEVLEIAGKVVNAEGFYADSGFLLIERNLSEDTVAISRSQILIMEEEYA